MASFTKGWSANLKGQYNDTSFLHSKDGSKKGKTSVFLQFWFVNFWDCVILWPPLYRRRLIDFWQPCQKEPSADPGRWAPSAALGQRGLWWHPSRQVSTARGRRGDQTQASGSPSIHGGPYVEDWVRRVEDVLYEKMIGGGGGFLPGSDPRLCVHLQTTAPDAMLLRASRKETLLGCQFLCQSTDVIGLKPTAASDVTYTCVVRFPGIFLHVPSGQDPGL